MVETWPNTDRPISRIEKNIQPSGFASMNAHMAKIPKGRWEHKYDFISSEQSLPENKKQCVKSARTQKTNKIETMRKCSSLSQ